MTRTTIRIPLFAALFGMAFVASAQTATPAATQDEVSASAPGAVAAEADRLIDAKKELADSNCLTQTGSRISPRADKHGRKCVNAPGRSYSKADLDRTGATDMADALRRLDPSVR
jgi:hypothetical protein